MTDQIDIQILFHALLKRWRKIAMYSAIGALVGVVVAFSIPKEYESSIVLVPERGLSSSSSSMGGLASMMGVNVPGATSDGINEKIYPEIVGSSLFINEFREMKVSYEETDITLYDYMSKYNRKPWWSSVLGLPSKFISLFSSSEERNGDYKYDFTTPSLNDVNFELGFSGRVLSQLDKKSGLLSIGVKMQDAKIAAIVADSIIVKLQKYVHRYKTSKTRDDLENKQQMLNNARTAYYEAENAYAMSQDKNQNLTSKTAITKLDRLRNEKDLAFSVYQQLATQVEANKVKLQEETPVITVLEPARVPVQPIAPNKKMILIAFTFLGAFIISVKILMKELFKKPNQNSSEEVR